MAATLSSSPNGATLSPPQTRHSTYTHHHSPPSSFTPASPPSLSPRITASLGPPPDRRLTLAYYCSPHGFGHATRVLAVSQWLVARGHRVVIATTAPEHLFASLTYPPNADAAYRRTHICAASIVQPTAYTLSRRETFERLERFMEEKNRRVLIEDESKWLEEEGVDCVLADAPGLPCTAATAASIPSVLVTNFTFDSCYSYLSAPSPSKESGNGDDDELADPPIPAAELKPLVDLCISDYANASLILRLPGYIPFPAFDGLHVEDGRPLLPSPASEWVDVERGFFKENIERDILARPTGSPIGSTSSSQSNGHPTASTLRKRIVPVPLIVRPLSPSVYTPSFRSTLLDSIGVPSHLHDPATTKILVVSFGGQAIPRPADGSDLNLLPPGWIAIVCGGTAPAAPSRSNSGLITPIDDEPAAFVDSRRGSANGSVHGREKKEEEVETLLEKVARGLGLSGGSRREENGTRKEESVRRHDVVAEIRVNGTEEPKVNELKRELPERFYACPGRDVYVPDLTAHCDVVLGKLGYGTCSETLATKTPFVYVPRPLFVEEYGLKRLMRNEGTCVEMDRRSFESGSWASFIEEAWRTGGKTKETERSGNGNKHGKNVDKGEAGLVVVRELEKFLGEWEEMKDGETL